MKRITALLLALVMCFALCACGSTPDPNLKEEDLAGTWSPSLWFLSTQLKLNSDGTYDYGEEKGTFGVLINNVTLSPRHSNANHDYVYSEGYLYSTRFSFDEDEEYGRAFSPDENGMASQKFSCNLGDGLMFDPALVENSIELTLYNDGTFSIFTSVFRYSSSLRFVMVVASVYRRTVSRKSSMSMRLLSSFFSSSRRALIFLAFSPCSCS